MYVSGRVAVKILGGSSASWRGEWRASRENWGNGPVLVPFFARRLFSGAKSRRHGRKKITSNGHCDRQRRCTDGPVHSTRSAAHSERASASARAKVWNQFQCAASSERRERRASVPSGAEAIPRHTNEPRLARHGTQALVRENEASAGPRRQAGPVLRPSQTQVSSGARWNRPGWIGSSTKSGRAANGRRAQKLVWSQLICGGKKRRADREKKNESGRARRYSQSGRDGQNKERDMQNNAPHAPANNTRNTSH